MTTTIERVLADRVEELEAENTQLRTDLRYARSTAETARNMLSNKTNGKETITLDWEH